MRDLTNKPQLRSVTHTSVAAAFESHRIAVVAAVDEEQNADMLI